MNDVLFYIALMGLLLLIIGLLAFYPIALVSGISLLSVSGILALIRITSKPAE